MNPKLTNLAIQLALSQDWKQAIKVNLELLDANEEDVAALNRLAFAYIKSGQINQAKTTYKKVLKIDKYNPIAQKNLKWLSNITKEDIHDDTGSAPSPTIFIEEPGKTKIVTLVNPAPIKILCNMMTAQKVTLLPKKHTIEMRTIQGIYIGALPDDLSHRLLKFIAGGNEYDAYIKNIQKNTISIFLREVKRGKKFHDFPSFTLSNGTYNPARMAGAQAEDGDETTPQEEEE